MNFESIPFERLKNTASDLRSKDTIWTSGRYFGFTYTPEKSISEKVSALTNLFEGGNTINPFLFNSLKEIEKELVSTVGNLLHAPKGFSGHFTSGGTESIILSVKSALELFRERDTINQMEVIISDVTHPAFLKAIDLLNLKAIRVPIIDSYTIDVQQLPNFITPKTGLVVASAPNYPFGTIDPIEDIAKITRTFNVPLHVDACLGGMILPFISDTKFDFQNTGVTSISVDLHKFGYAPKGSSLILYRDAEMAARQYFITDEWKGGIYGSVRLTGTTGTRSLVGSWATVKLLGKNGYQKMADEVMEARKTFIGFVNKHAYLDMVSSSNTPVISFRSSQTNSLVLGDLLEQKGWYLERLSDPDRLHMIISYNNAGQIYYFIRDLEELLQSSENQSTAYDQKIKWFRKAIGILPTNTISFINKFLDKIRSRDKPVATNRRFLYGLKGPGISDAKMVSVMRKMMQEMNSIK